MRLHIVPHDNSPGAQALKLRVRDRVIGRVEGLFAGCEDGEAAWRVARARAEDIGAWARRAAYESGYRGIVSVRAGMQAFEDREYMGKTVPAGNYRTLRISLGNGGGDNWWCVVYPSLCMPEDYRPGMKVEFYSVIARWLENLFGGERDG